MTAFPATIVVKGNTLHLRGRETYQNPVLSETDPVALTVFAAQTGDGANCTLVPRAQLMSEDSSSVMVAVGTYGLATVAPTGGLACAAIGLAAVPLKLALSSPLVSRSLIDATDGQTRAVLDPATVPKPALLPPGVFQLSVGWSEQPKGVARQYSGPGGASISLTVTEDLQAFSRARNKVLTTFEVNGHAATMSAYPGFDEDFEVQWQPDANHLITMAQASNWPARHGLSGAQMQAMAQSVR